MSTNRSDEAPIACMLNAGDYHSRMAWISSLNAAHLIASERDDLRLTLTYDLSGADAVRELVRREQACCGFLTFDVRSEADRMHLSIAAPEAAREAAETIFQQFAASTEEPDLRQESKSRGGPRTMLAGVTVLAGGAAACAACCVVPVALPAIALSGAGSIIAWFAGASGWIAVAALAAVAASWSWLAWDGVKARRFPRSISIAAVATASTFVAIAIFWPSIEPVVLSSLGH